MRTKEITGEDLDAAMDEMKESATKLIMSVGKLAKEVDWKSIAPKVIMALVVLYGIRNHKVIRSLVTSMAVGAIGEKLMPQTAKATA